MHRVLVRLERTGIEKEVRKEKAGNTYECEGLHRGKIYVRARKEEVEIWNKTRGEGGGEGNKSTVLCREQNDYKGEDEKREKA